MFYIYIYTFFAFIEFYWFYIDFICSPMMCVCVQKNGGRASWWLVRTSGINADPRIPARGRLTAIGHRFGLDMIREGHGLPNTVHLQNMVNTQRKRHHSNTTQAMNSGQTPCPAQTESYTACWLASKKWMLKMLSHWEKSPSSYHHRKAASSLGECLPNHASNPCSVTSSVHTWIYIYS